MVFSLLFRRDWRLLKLNRAALGEDEREEFGKIVDYFDKNLSPMAKEMTFLLGFYVSNVVKRWWEQAKSLPWPDTLVAISHALVDFNHEDGMKFCQTIMRYSMLSYILCGKYKGSSYWFIIAHTMFVYSQETQQGPQANVPGQRLSGQGQGGHQERIKPAGISCGSQE